MNLRIINSSGLLKPGKNKSMTNSSTFHKGEKHKDRIFTMERLEHPLQMHIEPVSTLLWHKNREFSH